MRPLTFAALAIACAVLFAKKAGASTTYELWFDAQLNAESSNPALDKTSLIEGDVLTIHVDPSRLFPTPYPVDSYRTAFAPGATPSELLGFYVAATAGARTPYYVQSGTCTVGSPAAPTTPALACQPDANKPWVTSTPGMTVLLCSAKPAMTIENMVKASGAQWSLVYDMAPPGGGATVRHCVANYTVTPTNDVDHVAVTMATGGALPETLPAVMTNGVWTITTTLKPGQTNVVMQLARKSDVAIPIQLSLPKFVVKSQDEHSLVRVQAEILTTNRARAVSFAVAISPVTRGFFESGPWRDWCVVFCGITPQALVRLSGDQGSVVQIGLGLGIYITPPFQFNAGFLFGTNDLSTTWLPDRSWYVGFAIDPFLLTETKTTSTAEVSK
jgi:hypothetical protein